MKSNGKQTTMNVKENQWEPMQIEIIQWQQMKNNENQLQPMTIKYIHWKRIKPSENLCKAQRHNDKKSKETHWNRIEARENQ